MDIQWYPGHMTKARRMMEENLKLIDLIIELIDARIPESSRNPDIDRLGNGKSRLLILNKADLAEKDATERWKVYYENKGYVVITADSKHGVGIKQVRGAVKEACKARIERNRRRGILNRPMRAMIAGIPNVGKSTFINSLVGKASAKTGNKPGVTKGKQWISLGKELELLDTPGILWPKFEDKAAAMKLALIGSIKDEILQEEELALNLIDFLTENKPGMLKEKYLVVEEKADHEILFQIAESRKCLKSGGEYDTAKAAMFLLDDFRNGKLGTVTMEYPIVSEDK